MFSMRKLKSKTLAIPLFILGVCATFQNCDSGFHYDPSSGDLSSLSTSTDLTGVFGLVVYAPGGTSPLDSNTSMDTGFDYEFRATGSTTSSAILSFSINSTSTTATCSLSSVGNVLKRSVKCTTAGVVKVDVQAVWPDSTMSSVSLTKNVGAFTATPTPTPTSSDTVEFRVRAGTGGSPWNTSSTPIQTFVGQTLIVYNDDTINHRIHTNGSPFAHQPGDTAPNASTSFVILSAHSGTATDTYDHNAGTSANIYIEALDGTALYSKATGPGSCASCHGGSVATSAKRGASFTSIKNAITNNTGNMRGITLSDQELKAIAYILNK